MKKHLKFTCCKVHDNDFGDWISFVISDNLHFHLVYRNPLSDLINVSEVFHSILCSNHANFIMGDFNF